MFKLKWYILIGFLGYVAFVVANIPASMVAKQTVNLVESSPIILKGVSGTVWNGVASVVARQSGGNLPTIGVIWHLRLWKLLFFQSPFHYQIRGQGFRLEGGISVSPRIISVENTKGHISSAIINEFTKSENVELSGRFELENLNLDVNFLEKSADKAEGRLFWKGGEVNYTKGRRPLVIQFPAIEGLFSESEGSLGLVITDVSEGKVLSTVEIAPTGWAKLSVMKRVLALAGQMRPGKNEDKSLIEIQQKLF